MWSAPSVQGKHRSSLEEKFKAPASHDDEHYSLPDYDILLTILSVLKWKQLNGTIKLYGDSRAVSYYAQLGMLELWDAYNTEALDGIDCDEINPSLFWSAGKFFALLNEPSPSVYLDLDMVIWRNLEKFHDGDADARCTHWEAVDDSSWYCRIENLRRAPDYEFKRGLDMDYPLAANTSIIYFKNEALKNYYASEALRFMRNNCRGMTFPNAATPEMLFAEQRLLPLCAKETDSLLLPYIDVVWSASRSCFEPPNLELNVWRFYSIRNQPLLTHTWHYKRHIEVEPTVRRQYCLDLVNAILEEFPQQFGLLQNIDFLRKYLPDA